MPANINFKNGKASMMYVKEVPWHSLGTKLEQLATAKEAIEAAQLDYLVEKMPMKAVMHDGKTLLHVPNHFATVRMDTKEALGVVGARYHVIQNVDAFKFFDSLVGEGEAIYETAGALGNGERIWILAKLPSYIKVHGKDIVDKYLLLTNSHDGSSIVRAKLTPVRVVCENTLSVALHGSEQEVRIRHTASAEEALEEAHKILGLSNVIFDQLDTIFNRMSLQKITGEQLVNYVKTLVPDNEEADRHTRTENIRDKMLELHEAGSGSHLSRGTLWGAYNSVTEFVDHMYNDTKVEKKLASMWFGTGERLKIQAFDLAQAALADMSVLEPVEKK